MIQIINILVLSQLHCVCLHVYKIYYIARRIFTLPPPPPSFHPPPSPLLSGDRTAPIPALSQCSASVSYCETFVKPTYLQVGV